MVFQEAIFWILAVSSVAAALGVVLLRDIFRAALLLVVVFLGVAGTFVLMNAEFLAVVQVLIYAGAIAILIIFAIMLTRDVQSGNLPNRLQAAAVLLPGLLLAALIFVAVDTDWTLLEDRTDWDLPGDSLGLPDLKERVELVQTNSIAGIPDEDGEINRKLIGPSAERSGIGELLINDFVLPFEAASVLLLAAVIGALVLVRER